MLCPGCGGVLDSSQQLKSVHKEAYDCALCSRAYEPTLDEMVEVAFTVSPRVRRIAAHDPHLLPVWEYFRQIFWGTGIDLPEDGLRRDDGGDHHRLDGARPRREGADCRCTLPAEFVIVFEPVTHFAHFIDVKGEPTKERQNLALIFNKAHSPTVTTEMRPGPLRIAMENKSDVRALPTRLDRRASSARSARQAAAVPDREAAAHQPDVPRHLSHRHARRRSGAEDHEPDVPVHRPQGLDRALRAGRRYRRLRSRARALPRAERDRRVGGGRGGQDHRRRGDGDVPVARPRARRGVAHARVGASDIRDGIC